jgi:hypothetical protein
MDKRRVSLKREGWRVSDGKSRGIWNSVCT